MLATPQTPSKVNLCLLFRDLGTRITIRRPSLPNRTTPSFLPRYSEVGAPPLPRAITKEIWP